MMGLSVTYLDSSFPDDNPRFNLPGYYLVRADSPNNTKRGSVCIYFKESLTVRSVMSKGMPFTRTFI